MPSFAGEDEPHEAEDRPEAEGGSGHLRHVDHIQRSGHEVTPPRGFVSPSLALTFELNTSLSPATSRR